MWVKAGETTIALPLKTGANVNWPRCCHAAFFAKCVYGKEFAFQMINNLSF